MRTRPCVRLFRIIDTLTSASVLPGVNDILEELWKKVVFASHDCIDNMSRPWVVVVRFRPADRRIGSKA